LLDLNIILKAKHRYNWVIVFGDATKNPQICGEWKKKTQTDEELTKLYESVKDKACNWGPITGINDLNAFDFDWAWIFGLWLEHFRDRSNTLITETPNGGARVYFLTNETMRRDPYKKILHLEIKTNHYVAAGGEAITQNGDLQPYTICQDQPIKRDDRILEDTVKYLDKLLKKRYAWTKYHCIQAYLERCKKKIVLPHDAGLAIAGIMYTNGCKEWEIHNLRKAVYNYKDGKYTLEYDKNKTEAQIQSTRQYIESGGKPFTCEHLLEAFGGDEKLCRGCARKSIKLVEDRPLMKEEEEESRKEQIAKAFSILMDGSTFAAPKDVEILYIYEDGVYVLGETEVKAAVEEILGEDASIGICNEVIQHLVRKSYVPRSSFNKFRDVIPVENGLLDLKNMQLSDFDPKKIFTFKVNAKFDQSKDCPKFKAYLEQVLPNIDDRTLLQEYAGYTLMPAFPHHKFMFLYGTGRNGKGVFIRTMEGLLDENTTANVPLECIDGSHRFAATNLFGILMNTCSEPSTRKPFKTELLKKICGQDSIDGEIKGVQNPLRFKSFAKFYVVGNKYPLVDDRTLSFWDRVLIIGFNETFTDTKGNKVVDIEKIWLNNEDERSGILNWLITGLKRLNENGKFTQTKSMDKKILEFKQVSDPIGAFLTDPNECTYGPALWTTRNALYDAYKNYAEDLGATIESPDIFVGRVRRTPGVVERWKKVGGKNERVWKGIGLGKKTPILEDFEEDKVSERKSDTLGTLDTPSPTRGSREDELHAKGEDVCKGGIEGGVVNGVSGVSGVSPPPLTTPMNPETVKVEVPEEEKPVQLAPKIERDPGSALKDAVIRVLEFEDGSVGILKFNDLIRKLGLEPDKVLYILGGDPHFIITPLSISYRKVPSPNGVGGDLFDQDGIGRHDGVEHPREDEEEKS